MSDEHPTSLSVLAIDVITSLGSNEAAYSAMDARLRNFAATGFHYGSEELVGAAIPWEAELCGTARQVELLAHTLECLASKSIGLGLAQVPVLLCLADDTRPGQPRKAGEAIALKVQERLSIWFHPASRFIAAGQCAIAHAFDIARHLVSQATHAQVVIAAVDSLLQRGVILAALEGKRLINQDNSEGFIPGEAAGALLVGPAAAEQPLLEVSGIGLASEAATRLSAITNNGVGLADAMRAALVMAGFAERRRSEKAPGLIETRVRRPLATRMADASGETFYFNEAATAAIRVFKSSPMPARFLLPAELLGETGAAAGILMLGWCEFLKRRSAKPALPALLHFSDENGERAALVVT